MLVEKPIKIVLKLKVFLMRTKLLKANGVQIIRKSGCLSDNSLLMEIHSQSFVMSLNINILMRI